MLQSSLISFIACSGSRATTIYDKNNLTEMVSSQTSNVSNMIVFPVIQGIPGVSNDNGSLNLGEEIAERSRLDYRAEEFPVRSGLKRLIDDILRNEGVPVEIGAIPWVESDYDVGCHSHMAAAGPWQFIRGTAIDLGLEMNDEIDERYSWIAATRAAARYLREMHSRLGEWSLAIAAYNCGEGMVYSRMGENLLSFEQIDLPDETEQFVPRVAAAVQAYTRIDVDNDRLAVVWIPSGFDLRLLAASLDVHPDSIMNLNRQYLKEKTPGQGDGWEIIIPADFAVEAFRKAWEIDRSRYRVNSGDSWISIAASLGVAESSIREVNPDIILYPDIYLELPVSERTPVNMAYGGSESVIVYTVKSGDTLGEIGEIAGVSSVEVARWNEMSPEDMIFPGQRLVLWMTEDSDNSLSEVGEGSEIPDLVTGDRGIEHLVVEGDTLWDISLKYNVSIEQIIYLNSLENSVLSIGDVLVIIEEQETCNGAF